ncbi:MAG: glycosyltransferase [Pyrinomonadaceae bacterium]
MRILYVVYWGALEQLGRSLVIPSVLELKKRGAEILLLTFEKPDDASNDLEFRRLQGMFAEAGVRWIPLRYHRTPKLPATLLDIVQGVLVGLKHGRETNLIHARTFIGGLIGWPLSRLLGVEFIYHNEGFYPDEQVDGGVWNEGSFPHRFAKWLEDQLYTKSRGIIALSHRAVKVISSRTSVSAMGTPVVFVPSCVDLERFCFSEKAKQENKNSFKFVYIGSVGGRYILDRVAAFVSAVRQKGYDLTLQIFSKSEPELIVKMMQIGGLEAEAWRLEAIRYEDMSSRLAEFDAGLFFLTRGLSEHGCSPTKIGEYWAVGLPVISTANVSDTDELIQSRRVGSIVVEHSEHNYVSAFEAFLDLLKDPELSNRCRNVAIEHYSLDSASDRIMDLYSSIKATSSD